MRRDGFSLALMLFTACAASTSPPISPKPTASASVAIAKGPPPAPLPPGARMELESGAQSGVAALSGDGKTLVTSAYDGTARVWDVATGMPETPLRHLSASGNAVVVANRIGAFLDAAGEAIVLAHDDQLFFVDRKSRTMTKRVRLSPNCGQECIAASRDHARLAYLGANGVEIADLRGNVVATASKINEASVHWLDDGRTLGALTEDSHTLVIVDGATGKTEAPIHGRDVFFGPTFSPDGQTLAARTGPAVTVWDRKTHALRFRVPMPGDPPVFSRDSRELYFSDAVSAERALVVVDAATGRETKRVALRGSDEFCCAPPVVEGDRVIVVTESVGPEKALVAIDPKSGAIEQLVPDGAPISRSAGRFVLNRKGVVDVFDLATKTRLMSANSALRNRESRAAQHVAWDPNGAFFAAVLTFGQIVIFDAKTGEKRVEIAAPSRHEKMPSGVVITADGALVAGVGGELRSYSREGTFQWSIGYAPLRWTLAPKSAC